MSLNALYRSFEERKNSLIDKLEGGREELDLSQQHQIYGAIKEIEQFLRSIDYYRTLEAERGFDLELSQEREWPLVKRTQRMMSKAGKKTSKVFKMTFVKGPSKLKKNIQSRFSDYREQREIYKEVREEVKKRKLAKSTKTQNKDTK